MVNRLQKVLEWANIKLGNVVTDLTGVSPRRMLQGIVEGQTNVQDLAALAKGSLSRKQEQLLPSASHLAKWARLCPGNHESAGKRLSGKTGRSNPGLRTTLVQAEGCCGSLS